MEYILNIVVFLFSWPGILVTILLVFMPWVFIYTVVMPRRLEPLRKYFTGTVSPWGVVIGDLLRFTVDGRAFILRSQSTGGVDANRTRLTYYLATMVDSQPAFYLGHTKLTDYFFQFNLGSGDKKDTVIVGPASYQIGSDTEDTLSRLRKVLSIQPGLDSDLALLFSAPWSHLKVRSVNHVGVGTVHECTYYGLPQDKVLEPVVVEQYVKALERVLRVLLVS